MKKHILKILKEETENDFENKILKGINIAVTSLKNDFPFIKGWELDDSIDEFKSSIYINLFVDPIEVQKFYNLEKRELYDLYFERYLTYPFSAFEYNGITPFDENQKIIELLNDNYSYVPDEWKMNTSYGMGYDLDKKKLMIESYFYKT